MKANVLNEKKAFKERGSIEHMLYFAKKFNIAEGNIGANIVIDEKFLHESLFSFLDLIDSVFGKEYRERILKILLNLKLKKATPPFALYRQAEGKKVEHSNKEKKDRKNKTDLDGTEYKNKFGDNNTEDGNIWRNLPNEVKEKYKKMSKKQQDVYEL